MLSWVFTDGSVRQHKFKDLNTNFKMKKGQLTTVKLIKLTKTWKEEEGIWKANAFKEILH